MKCYRLGCFVLILALTGTSLIAGAEKYQSRLNSLLVKKEDLYLPSRLVVGEEAQFVLRAPAGSQVKVFLSPQGEGYTLPDETPLPVGTDPQILSGTVPENGVLTLKMTMPKTPEMVGKVIYVAAAAAPPNQPLAPVELVDSTGRRTTVNTLVIVKANEVGNGPAILPSLPGVSPQMFSQLSNMGQIYSQGTPDQKQLLDNGAINQDSSTDRNPFINRGLQQGINGSNGY